MKNSRILVLLSTVLFVASGFSQTTEKTPETPKTQKTSKRTKQSVHVDCDSSSSSSFSYSTTDSGTKSKTNISISRSDESYSLTSQFPKAKFEEVRELLINELGEELLIKEKGSYNWGVHYNKDLVYEVVLKDDRLNMFIDKKIASADLVKKIEDLGDAFRSIFVDVEAGEAVRIQRDAERVERDAIRVEHEADRLDMEAQRLRQHLERDALRLKQDAERLERDAERLRQEAERLRKEAAEKEKE